MIENRHDGGPVKSKSTPTVTTSDLCELIGELFDLSSEQSLAFWASRNFYYNLQQKIGSTTYLEAMQAFYEGQSNQAANVAQGAKEAWNAAGCTPPIP